MLSLGLIFFHKDKNKVFKNILLYMYVFSNIETIDQPSRNLVGTLCDQKGPKSRAVN
jgi:hypothetical protein